MIHQKQETANMKKIILIGRSIIDQQQHVYVSHEPPDLAQYEFTQPGMNQYICQSVTWQDISHEGYVFPRLQLVNITL